MTDACNRRLKRTLDYPHGLFLRFECYLAWIFLKRYFDNSTQSLSCCLIVFLPLLIERHLNSAAWVDSGAPDLTNLFHQNERALWYTCHIGGLPYTCNPPCHPSWKGRYTGSCLTLEQVIFSILIRVIGIPHDVEGWSSSEHFKHKNSKCPPVHWRIILLSYSKM